MNKRKNSAAMLLYFIRCVMFLCSTCVSWGAFNKCACSCVYGIYTWMDGWMYVRTYVIVHGNVSREFIHIAWSKKWNWFLGIRSQWILFNLWLYRLLKTKSLDFVIFVIVFLLRKEPTWHNASPAPIKLSKSSVLLYIWPYVSISKADNLNVSLSIPTTFSYRNLNKGEKKL